MLCMTWAETFSRGKRAVEHGIPELGPDGKCPVCGETRELDPEDLDG